MRHVIKQGTRAVYVGPGDGRGLRHTVVSVRSGEIATWSDPIEAEGIAGYSWLGPERSFQAHFRLAAS